MLLAMALLIIGLLLVAYGADRLVFAASILCRTFGIPPLIIGMTVVSIGTSLPEIIVSVAASLHGQLDLAVGAALGSNITNILLILGLAELPREGGLPVAFLWLGIALVIMPMATRMVIDNATVLANYFAMSELTLGLTVIAVGTSLPELATAIAGVRKGENDIAVGNLIGANIFNLAIVLGLPALIAPGEINPLAFGRDYSVMLLVSVVFALLCWRHPRQIGRGAGILLTGGFIVWLAMLYWLSPLLIG
ncbi:calcium/sodium antiporter [Salmonella enterica]|uniref:calcium/sodium antiporter n=1 Tax=Salmonella enterica TaxID=28901 RepID=UPI0009AC0498|nr:calcium/sodium antiporter [Salmonella enterica]